MKIGTGASDFSTAGKNGIGSFNFDDEACDGIPNSDDFHA